MAQMDGEKELVLGNKQLISLFFVVVALCGVFFAMGYMVRGSSIRDATLSTGEAAASPTASSEKLSSRPEPPAETASASPASDSTPPTETRPAADVPAATPPDASPKPAADTVTISEPQTGASYLQVRALVRADAESVVRTLREQNFPTILAASSKDGLFRVLVGPFHQTSDVADAKSRLKTLGFADAFVQKQ